MKPLEEEVAIHRIFRIANSVDIETPSIFDVEFYTDHGRTLGHVGVYGNGSKVFGICTNYCAGEMNLSNGKFIETVCHELVHYNGIMNHGDEFKSKLRWLLQYVLSELTITRQGGMNGDGSLIGKNIEEGKSKDSGIGDDQQRESISNN